MRSVCRDRAGGAGAGLHLSVPAGEAVLWLPRRNPDENVKAGHPASHRLQHDNRYRSLFSPHRICIYDWLWKFGGCKCYPLC